MIMRAIDSAGDWLFGKGRNDYVSQNAAIGQDIQTRCLSFLGDCFFALGDGIDWFNLLGSSNSLGLQLALSSTILNTNNVTGLLALNVNLNETTRVISIQYQVQTVYSVLTGTFQYDTNGLD